VVFITMKITGALNKIKSLKDPRKNF
jgi:hypothetical protein